MKIKIEYESDMLLPEKIDKYFVEIKNRIIKDKNEIDKIQCHLSSLKGFLINWFAENEKKA